MEVCSAVANWCGVVCAGIASCGVPQVLQWRGCAQVCDWIHQGSEPASRKDWCDYVSADVQEVSEVEQSYSNSIQKLVKSPQYELHSNFIMQLLGSSPYEEIG